MNRVLRVDERIALLSKPSLQPIHSLNFRAGDTIIGCCGFEERAIAVLKKAIEEGCKGFSIVIIEYLPSVAENRLEEMNQLCKKHRIKTFGYKYDRRSPGLAAQAILRMIGVKNKRLFIDISGMSRLLIVQLLVALRNHKLGYSNSHILYAEAKDYPPKKSQFNAAISKRKIDPSVAVMFLSAGVFEVTIIPELSSIALQSQPIRLIDFPSFNPDQLIAIRAVVQPSSYTLINGNPPYRKYFWRKEAIRKLNSTDTISSLNEQETSTLDYRETLKLLLELYDKYNEFEKLVIAPTGSKMQAVGVGLFKAFLDDVQIVYPTPRVFKEPHAYTVGVKTIYQLPLSSFVI